MSMRARREARAAAETPQSITDRTLTTRIRTLEQELEKWKWRAENAEAALEGGKAWNTTVPPMTPCETRIMRLLSQRDMTVEALERALVRHYPTVDCSYIQVRFSQLRTKLPADISPGKQRYHHAPYTVEDREALKAFLQAGAP